MAKCFLGFGSTSIGPCAIVVRDDDLFALIKLGEDALHTYR